MCLNPDIFTSILVVILNQKLVSLSDSEQSGFIGKLKVHKSGKVK